MNENGMLLAQNPYVQELFALMYESGRDASGLVALLGHVSEMESFIKNAEDTISVMKSQLSEMKEVQNHPVKTALQNTIKSLEQKVAAVKEQLSELKSNIIGGCKNAAAAFKEKGITALDKLASFFHIKSGLQGWQKNIDSIIRDDDKAVAKIEAFANEYHSVGRAVKNMARVAVGKEPLDAKKEAGKLAAFLAAPYKSQKRAVTGLRESLGKAVAGLEQLEHAAAPKQAERERTVEKKPSLLGKLETNKVRVARIKREMPMPERTKTQGLDV